MVATPAAKTRAGSLGNLKKPNKKGMRLTTNTNPKEV
jgi:hypothetical protein